MKKNRFQQQIEENKKQNYFDDEEDIDLEEDGLFGKDVLSACMCPLTQQNLTRSIFRSLINSIMNTYKSFQPLKPTTKSP